MERFISLRKRKTIRYNNYRVFFILSNKILEHFIYLLFFFLGVNVKQLSINNIKHSDYLKILKLSLS